MKSLQLLKRALLAERCLDTIELELGVMIGLAKRQDQAATWRSFQRLCALVAEMQDEIHNRKKKRKGS